MGRANHRVFSINEEAVAQGVPSALLGTPLLLGMDGDPDFWACEYMLARRNGDWSSEFRGAGKTQELYGRKPRRAKLNFLRNRVYQLDIFSRWRGTSGTSYEGMHEPDLERYAEDLEEGLLSDLDCLLPGTVNQYITSAIDVLRYGERRGWRPTLYLEMQKVERLGRRASYRPVILRTVQPQEITSWYTEEQIRKYLEEFETSSVKVCAKILYKTGLRISEALGLPFDAFPTPEQFRRGPKPQFIRVTGKFRKTRKVPIDEELVRIVDSYKRLDRRRIERKLEGPDTLLIALSNDGRAKSLSPRYVQKEFARVRKAMGMEGLSPHMLRHHYAAHFLLDSWRRRTLVLGQGPVPFDIGPAQAILSHDLFMLKESLGHASIDTTMGYINAIAYLWPNRYSEEYSDGLDGDLR